jgi:uncharacterized membrane protein YfcA
MSVVVHRDTSSIPQSGRGERTPLWLLAAIGIVTGFFSALFGIGGGFVLVPLLILAARFPPDPAVATSLAAIGITATFGVGGFTVLNVIDWSAAAVIALPAILGTFFGMWLHSRVASTVLVRAFAVMLVLVAIRLYVE